MSVLITLFELLLSKPELNKNSIMDDGHLKMPVWGCHGLSVGSIVNSQQEGPQFEFKVDLSAF